MNVVLASASPRRRRLLKRIVKRFSVSDAGISERMMKCESFTAAAIRLAERKAQKVAERNPRAVVIGADTVAYFGKRNCRKADSEAVAEKILRELSGKTHTVVTGVCVIFPDGRKVKYAVSARVKMKKISEARLAAYLKSGEWKGRAGSYDFSGKGRKLVAQVLGEKETVVGLPLARLKNVLKGLHCIL